MITVQHNDAPLELELYTDGARHLICVPYSEVNLHLMAEAIGVKRCWFHNNANPHYDIPVRRKAEIESLCKIISSRDIVAIIKEAQKMNLKNDLPPKKVPSAEHQAAAKKEYDKTHGEGSFDNLPTRKRNSLARDQMFHQEYHDLARAIMGK